MKFATDRGNSRSKTDRLSSYWMLTRTYLYIVKRLYRDTLQPLAANLSGFTVDIGCGHGTYRGLLKEQDRYIGLDLNWKLSPDAVADAQSLPLVAIMADSVLCSEVLEHVTDPAQVMIEIHRVLKPGGLLLLTAPMSWNLHYEPFDFRRYTSYGLWQLLEEHGFDVVATRRIGGLFAVVGSRLVDGIAAPLYQQLGFLPRKVRHAVLLCYSMPTSVLFFYMSRLLDSFQQSDAIGWAVLGRRRE